MSHNVTGIIGPETDDKIIVCAHVDGHDISQGALDNASGVAAMCEVAAGLASIRNRLEIQVRFIGFGAEKLGLVGSQHYADENDLANIKAVVNCDDVGRARDLRVKSNGFTDFEKVVEQIASEFDHPIQIKPKIATHSDHWPFVWRGIPGLMMKSDTGVGRGYGHTFADTIDKTDTRAIRDHGILISSLIRMLAETDIEIASRLRNEKRGELIKEQQDISMRIAEEWPFDR